MLTNNDIKDSLMFTEKSLNEILCSNLDKINKNLVESLLKTSNLRCVYFAKCCDIFLETKPFHPLLGGEKCDISKMNFDQYLMLRSFLSQNKTVGDLFLEMCNKYDLKDIRAHFENNRLA